MKKNKSNMYVVNRLVLCFLLICNIGIAQEMILTYPEFMTTIRSYHPLVKQSVLAIDIQGSKLLSARGAFDPNISYISDQKTFDGKNYYQYNNAEVYLPTWYGIELYTGIENNRGAFLNPEITPNNSTYAGISLPLGRDLILDKRRAKLKQSKVILSLTAVEQRLILNDLMAEAAQDYIEWSKTNRSLVLIDETLALFQIRKEAIAASILGGDRASIDSIEIKSQIDLIRQEREALSIQSQQWRYVISSYLWNENMLPLTLSAFVYPDTSILSEPIPASMNLDDLPSIVANHPKIQSLNLKLDIERIEQKLTFQSLLPKADLKYNVLTSGTYDFRDVGNNFLQNNYKFGIDFSIPIPNRMGRGEYRAQRSKVSMVTIDRDYTSTLIQNKIAYSRLDVIGYQNQQAAIRSALNGYQELREAELIRFGQGESTVFMINARETKLLETNLKFIQLAAKLQQSWIKYQAAKAVLW